MITGLNHITLAVRRLQRSLSFYTETLGCTLVHQWSGGAYLEAGSLWLCLSVSEHVDPKTDYTHIAFTTTPSGMAQLRRSLRLHHTPVWRRNVSEGDSIYVTDPDGHRLEIHVGTLDSRMASIRQRNEGQPQGCTAD